MSFLVAIIKLYGLKIKRRRSNMLGPNEYKIVTGPEEVVVLFYKGKPVGISTPTMRDANMKGDK